MPLSPGPRLPLVVTADSDLLDDLLRLAAAGGTEVDVAHDPAAARPRYANCSRIPPSLSLSGNAWHLNLTRCSPRICGRTSVSAATWRSGCRNLKTISGSPTAKPSS